MAQRIGDFLVSIGVMTAQQVEAVLETQRAGDTRSFGEIACSLGYVGDGSLKRFADYLDTHNESVV
jgi:hypothetical protein